MKRMVLMLLTVLLVIGLSVPTLAAGSVKLGLVAPFTGLGSILGGYIKEAMVLAVDEVNAKGGPRGLKLEMVVYDDAAAPAVALNVVQKVLSDDKVDILFGPNMSSAALAVHKLAAEAKVPMLVGATSPSLRYDVLKNPWLFRLRADDAVKVANQAIYTSKVLKAKRVGIIYGSTDYCLSAKKVIEEEFEKFGVKIVAAEQMKEGEKDATGQLLKLKAANIDALMGLTHEPEAAVIMRQFRQLGFKVPVVGFSAWGVPAFTDLAGQSAVGVIAVQGFTPEDPNPKVQEFVKKYKARWNRLPSDPAQAYYDGVYMVAQAIEKVGTDHEKIREYLENLKDFKGLQGKMNMDKHHNVTNYSLISEFKGNRWEIIDVVD